MTTNSLPQDPTAILAGVESFFDTLPPTKRGRTRAQINAAMDKTPEDENYGPAPEPTITIELDRAALTALPTLLSQLSKARSEVAAQFITAKIYRLLGLELE